MKIPSKTAPFQPQAKPRTTYAQNAMSCVKWSMALSVLFALHSYNNPTGRVLSRTVPVSAGVGTGGGFSEEVSGQRMDLTL